MSHSSNVIRRASARCCAIAAVASLLWANAAWGKVFVRDPAPDPLPATTQPADTVVWHETLEGGFKDAARRQRPMLIIYGAEWCGPCRALHKELERPEVREKLAHWTLVHLDVDKPEPGQAPYVGSIPALRVASSAGKTVASREGYLSGEELLRWLDDSAPKAGEVDPDLAGAEEPDAAATGRLLAMLTGRDADVRESAIKRLTPWPQLAAKPAADAFAKGNLRTRLAVLDLLAEWKAPIQGIDPWRPETVDAGRLDALKKWAAAVKGPSTRPLSDDVARIAAAQGDLKALLRAANPVDAGVISSRLARIGPALLPDVVRRLTEAGSDRDRERLTALRYRLVATEALSLNWPGGIDRLASSDPVTRHAAAEELSKRATAADGPLLLELFSDSDPLVREISLRGLQQVGGKEGASMLVKLLHDPVPNVRAAVLKQLAEQPDPQITAAVVEYITQEKDADLVVHAVRVLREAKDEAAVKCLIGLLTHESWRVRAESIDSLADISMKNNSVTANNDELVKAVIARLDDADGFVAGRAVAAMKPLMGSASSEALTSAINRHPELAVEVVKHLSSQGNDPAAQKTLRTFCSNPLPKVRAAAVVALANMAPRNCSDEVQTALHDKLDDVRAAGAAALFIVFTHELPHNGMIDKPSFFGFGGGPEHVDAVEWLDGFRAGKSRIPWFDACLADLQAMLKSDQQPVRLAAAYPLVAMGHEDDVLPLLLAAAKADASTREPACEILPWLPWEKRIAWLKALLSIELTDTMTASIASQMAVITDPRAADAVWALLDGTNGGGAIAQVHASLHAIYHLDDSGKTPDAESPEVKALKTAAIHYAQKGSDNQRLVAVTLMFGPATGDAAEQSKKVYEDPKAGDGLRMAAFQVLLLSQPAADAQRSASAALGAGGAKAVQPLALKFLAMGSNTIQEVHGIYLQYVNSTTYVSENGIRVTDLKAPAGLTAEIVQPYLKSDDHQLAACAGYLACLLGKKEGLAPLLAYWKEQGAGRHNETNPLVYRAIAALDDDTQTPLLEQIYQQYGQQAYEVRDFYWTIRSMHGEQILKLRKKIRDEVGMERLQ